MRVRLPPRLLNLLPEADLRRLLPDVLVFDSFLLPTLLPLWCTVINYQKKFPATVDGFPNLLWNVEVSVDCDRCLQPASLNDTVGGGVTIICDHCGWMVEGPGSSDAVALSVMKQGSEITLT